MSATRRLMQLDPTKSVVPFAGGVNHQFSHTDMQHVADPVGISNEEGELLYGLIRITQPLNVLETGTNIGVSASYICLGLEDNGFGHLTTIEHDNTVYKLAMGKLGSMGFKNFTVFNGEVKNYEVKGELDFLWLDSELNQRYGELLRFFPYMKPGSLACIHDLWSLDFKEFGGVPDELYSLIESGSLRALTFPTPHGVTIFQKRYKDDYLANIAHLKS